MRATIGKEPAKLFTPEKAEAVAAELRKADCPHPGEPVWEYIVRHDPKGTGLSFIEIVDEDGNSLGPWT
jgi:hypothetical protein